MNCSYDREVDIAAIRFRNGKVEYGEQVGDVITHYDKESKPVEIEILNASKHLAKMDKSILSTAKVSRFSASF